MIDASDACHWVDLYISGYLKGEITYDNPYCFIL